MCVTSHATYGTQLYFSVVNCVKHSYTDQITKVTASHFHIIYMWPVTKISVRGQNRSGGTIFGDQNWSPRTDFPAIIGPPVPKVVLPSISVKRATIMPPNVSKYDYGRQGVFQRWRRGSRRPDRGGLRLHDSKALPCRMYGRTKTKHKEKGSKVCCEGWGAILQEEAERQGQLSGNEARAASFILASGSN